MAAGGIQLVSLSRRERNANINVGSFDPIKKHSDRARWICVYPAYLNSKKTVSEGRKVSLKLAVENPTTNEIKDVLVNAGLQVEVEVNKVYPREPNKYENLSRGRIRVHLKNDDGTPVKPKFPTRDSVLLYLAETIPRLKTRGSGTSSAASQQSTATSSGSKNQKSKKK